MYSLGVTAYRLITGRYPPPAVDVEETEDGSRLIHPARVPPETWVSLCPELAGLIHQLLSPEPAARGSAAEVAQALEHAARTAGPAADQPITPRPPQAPTRLRAKPIPPRPVLAWLAAAGSLALVGGAWWLWHHSWVEPLEVVQEAREGKKDAGTVGLGESVLSTPGSVAPPEPAKAGGGLDVPKKAFPGQRRPPCEQPSIEINGGCWVRRGDTTPPCGAGSYAWKNACYWPLLDPPRLPTSGQP